MVTVDIDLGAYKLGWSDREDYVFKPEKGLNEGIIVQMSGMKGEPAWMLEFRLKAYQRWLRKPIPQWGGGGLLNEIDFDDIYYYIKPTEGQAKDWDMVPDSIKETYEKLGIPQAERKYLAGVTAQYESEVVYHRNREDLERLGVLFTDMDTAVREYPDIVREYFGTIIPPNDNKFAALNSAVWSGGSFIYVPAGVHLDQPLQAYFRINAENMGQFERTLIVVDEGAYCHYVEGCSAPVYSTDSLHSAVVEIVVKRGGRCRYTTIQNWSNNVYNLVTKRAVAYENATMEWVDGNLGSKLTMKYPAVWLMEPGAHGEVLSIAFAGPGQHLDAGAKMVHAASDTTSTITSKSISRGGGRAGAGSGAGARRAAPRARVPQGVRAASTTQSHERAHSKAFSIPASTTPSGGTSPSRPSPRRASARGRRPSGSPPPRSCSPAPARRSGTAGRRCTAPSR